MTTKKIIIYHEGYGEDEIMEDIIDALKEELRDNLNKKDAAEAADCEINKLSKFEITVTVEDRTGY